MSNSPVKGNPDPAESGKKGPPDLSGPTGPVAPVSPLGPLEVIATELTAGEATETDVELEVKLTEVPLPVEAETVVPPVVVTSTLIT